jgi:hypothetical protein
MEEEMLLGADTARDRSGERPQWFMEEEILLGAETTREILHAIGPHYIFQAAIVLPFPL